MAWQDSANCIGIDTELFFTEDQGQFPERVTLKEVCRRCPVKTECFEFAVNRNMKGWWGGTTTKERQKYRVKHGIVPEPMITEEYV